MRTCIVCVVCSVSVNGRIPCGRTAHGVSILLLQIYAYARIYYEMSAMLPCYCYILPVYIDFHTGFSNFRKRNVSVNGKSIL